MPVKFELPHLFVLFLVFLLPFVYSDALVYGYNFSKATFLIIFSQVAFASWLYLLCCKKDFSVNWKNGVTVLFFSYIALLTFSSWLGPDSSSSFWSSYARTDGLLLWYHLGLLYLVLSSLFSDKTFVTGTLIAFVSSTALTSVFFAFGPMFFDWAEFSPKSFSTIGNVSNAGTLYVVAIPLSVYLWKLTNSRTIKSISLFSILSLLVGPIILNPNVLLGDVMGLLGESRVVLPALTLGVLVSYAIFGVFSANKRRKIIGLSFLSAVLVGVGYLVFGIVNNLAFIQSIFTKLHLGSRLLFWQAGIEGFLERPILGWGRGMYELSFYKYFDPALYSQKYAFEIWTDKVHNLPLQVLIETGLVGFVVVLMLLGVISFYLARSEEGILGQNFWLLTAFWAFLVQSMVSTDSVIGWYAFIILLALISTRVHNNNTEQSVVVDKVKEFFRKKTYMQPLFAGSLIMLVSITIANLAILPYEKAKQLKIAINLPLENRLEMLTLWVDQYPQYPDLDYYLVTKELRFVDEILSTGNITSLKDDSRSINLALSRVQNLVELNPGNYKFLIRYMQLVNIRLALDIGSFDDEYQEVATLLEQYGSNPLTHQELAKYYYLIGDSKTALYHAEYGLSLVSEPALQDELQLIIDTISNSQQLVTEL
tara:strand:+ start:869 stop:2821 length:1953 start_codon:yes stop_codon:yes gene_type:complete